MGWRYVAIPGDKILIYEIEREFFLSTQCVLKCVLYA